MRKWKLIVVFLTVGIVALGQDPQFSQFYAAPAYISPAYTGATAENRVVLNYRHQWPAIPGAFVSYNVAYDRNLANMNSGIGFVMTRDKAGSGGLHYTSAALMYAYQFEVDRNFFIRPALQYGIVHRGIDYTNLVFGDQLIRNGATTSVENFYLEPITVFDVGSGLLLFSRELWIGVAAHHMNQPNQSLTRDESVLPMKFSVHGGARIKIDAPSKYATKDHYIIPAFNYKAQNKFDQFDLGFYYEYNPFVIGVWYRGIPGLKAYEPGYQNNDAFVILVGGQIKNSIKLGYSYDITISRLMANTGGSHEISLSWQWGQIREKSIIEQLKTVPCPKF